MLVCPWVFWVMVFSKLATRWTSYRSTWPAELRHVGSRAGGSKIVLSARPVMELCVPYGTNIDCQGRSALAI